MNARPLQDLQISTATVMFADIVEYVRLVQRDESGAVARMRRLLIEGANDVAPIYGGSTIQRTGDGLMLRFPDARGALRCSLALHDLAAAHSIELAEADRMRLRVGIHSAEIMSDENSLYGHGVNLTARIASLARPAETLLSSSARDQLTQNLDGSFEDMGPCFLKHVAKPVRLYRVTRENERPGTALLTSTALAPVLAILPFEPYQRSGPEVLLGDVLTDQVIAALSGTASVTLISQLSSHALRGRDLDVAEAARVLGADYILSGRYHVTDGRLRLQPELVDVRTMRVLWAQAVVGAAVDAIAANSDLVMRIASAVASATLRNEIEASSTRALPSIASHTLYLAAVANMHRFSPALFEHSRKMLELLHERAPRHPAPLAWLARWHMLRLVQRWSTSPKTDGNRAISYANRALDLDPESSLALTMTGCALRSVKRDMDGAQIYLERALASNPNNALAWLFKATIHGLQGEAAAAMEASDKALAMSPLDPMRAYYESLSASASSGASDHERTIVLASRALAGNVMHETSYRSLAIALWKLGRHEEARGVIARLLRVSPTASVQDFLDRAGHRARHNEEYARALAEAGLPRERPTPARRVPANRRAARMAST